jgi:urease accessory protein
MFDGKCAVWPASLALRFRSAEGRSLCASRHSGPLRVQKPLYPEGPALCHTVLIHPPGGIAGGDALELSIDVQNGAHALITTPGAAKWYKANGRVATQQVQLKVAGTLEWLPQEAIVFDAADVRSMLDIELDDAATMIGWDMVALGRRASGERFERGRFAQTIRLHRQGTLQWIERTCVDGDDRLLDSSVGLSGHPVFGCLWAAGRAVADCDIDQLRAELEAQQVHVPVTRVETELLVARTLGYGTAEVRAELTTLWSALRLRLCGLPARPPRLWAT